MLSNQQLAYKVSKEWPKCNQLDGKFAVKDTHNLLIYGPFLSYDEAVTFCLEFDEDYSMDIVFSKSINKVV